MYPASLLKCLGINFITLCSLKYFVSAFGNTSTPLDKCIFSSHLLSKPRQSLFLGSTDKTNRSAEPCFEHRKGSYYWNMLSENAAACNPHFLCFQRIPGLLFLKAHENPIGDGLYRASEMQGACLHIRVEMIWRKRGKENSGFCRWLF